MEIKKNPDANLEKLKPIFFEIGLALAIGFVLLAFEWKSTEKVDNSLGELKDVVAEEEIIPITRQEEVKPPEPAPQPQITEVLTIVENDVEIENEMEFTSEADQNTQVAVVEVKEEEEQEEAQVFLIVEEMPEFPGGDVELRKYIATNVKYPEIAKENGISGRVYIQFVINSKGMVTDVKVARGVDPVLDAEAIRVVQSMPAWKPGKQRGKPVKVSYTVPINFTLQ